MVGNPPVFIRARYYTKGRKAPIRLVVLHTTENTERTGTARAVALWFASKDAPKASAHYIIDNQDTYQCVLEEDTAWACGVANPFSISVELVGRAAQTEAGWDDEYSRAELRIAAERVAHICHMHNIPVCRPTDVRVNRGICDHHDITKAWKVKGGHWDIGEHFPWDSFLAQVQAALDGMPGRG